MPNRMLGIAPLVWTTECIAKRKTAPGIGSMPKTKGIRKMTPSLPPRPGMMPKNRPTLTPIVMSIIIWGDRKMPSNEETEVSSINCSCRRRSRRSFVLQQIPEQGQDLRLLSEIGADALGNDVARGRHDRQTELFGFGDQSGIGERRHIGVAQGLQPILRNSRRAGGQARQLRLCFDKRDDRFRFIGLGESARLRQRRAGLSAYFKNDLAISIVDK